MSQPPILDAFTLSSPQRAAALAAGGDVAVTAGAGTGKTRTLVARYLAQLDSGLPLRHIVAVTFTRKAAREMRNRVRQEIAAYLSRPSLDSEEKERWQRFYHELDAARIGTIHNLCAEILRAHPAEAAIDPRFTVLDETQSALLLQAAVEAALAWAVDTPDVAPLFELLNEQQLLELIDALIRGRIDAAAALRFPTADALLDHWQAALEAAQAAAVERLLADPGFVDARALLARNPADSPEDKMEVQRRLALAALDGLDGESLAGQLRRLSALDEINLSGGSQKSWPGGKEQRDEVKAALDLLRGKYRDQKVFTWVLNGQDHALAAAAPAIGRLFEAAAQTYRQIKEELEGLDFDDLEALAIQLLETQPAVCRTWQEQVQALLVDEFQDTNERQRHFLRLLCPASGRLFIVGDAKQSIYRFRGADVAVFAHEKAHIRSQQGVLIDLDCSYRAHEALLQGMNRLLRPVFHHPLPEPPPWVAPFAPLEPGTKEMAHGLQPPYIEFHLALGTKPQALPQAAAALAARLAHLHLDHGLDFGDMAILCRASSSFHFYEDALDEAGIPYLTVAGKGFYDRPEIRDLLNALQAIADPHDDIALTGLLRSPACGLSDVALYQLVQHRPSDSTLWQALQEEITLDDPQETARLRLAVDLVRDLHQGAGRTPAADLLKQFLDRTFYRAILRRAGQPRALRNVAKLLDDIHRSELVGVYDFLEYAVELRDSGTREGEARATAGGAVQIMSIHAAKGLEFPVVVLGDAGSGRRGSDQIAIDADLGVLLPYKNDEGQQAVSYALWKARDQEQEDAENARLLYVALTRAEQQLLISGYAAQTNAGGVRWTNWLDDLARAAGIAAADLSAYDAAGGEQHRLEIMLEDTPLSACFYEHACSAWQAAPPAQDTRPDTALDGPFPLREPLTPPPTAPDAGDSQSWLWPVAPPSPRSGAPAWIIGRVVHEALAQWRFPGPGFDAWAAARARAHGLTGDSRLRHAQREAARLLRRFQDSALFREMDRAERRLHELPYSLRHDGRVENGVIDVLYQHQGVWVLVDFKTDHLRNEVALQQALRDKGYQDQVRRYVTAVEALLGLQPRALLCFLDAPVAPRLITAF